MGVMDSLCLSCEFARPRMKYCAECEFILTCPGAIIRNLNLTFDTKYCTFIVHDPAVTTIEVKSCRDWMEAMDNPP